MIASQSPTPAVQPENCWSCTVPLPEPTTTRGNGYAIVPGLEGAEHKICYRCAADREANQMVATGRGVLYIADKGITNWTGALRFERFVARSGTHAFGPALYVRFIGPDNKVWSGKHIGAGNDLLHCKRTKLRSVYA